MTEQDKSDTSTPIGTPPIAVVGIGLQYPGASEPRTMWENILSRRRQFREMIDERLPLQDYYDPDPAVEDKTYGNRAAYIDGFDFDWKERRVPERSYDSTDIVHWLALDVAMRAVADWGHNRKSIPKERGGVVVGNTLTGEQVRSNSLRLRWPFVRRAIVTSAMAKGVAKEAAMELCEALEPVYKSAFPPITEDTLAGGLSNTIAGRICNYFDLDGGGFTVDGACSSSLIAVATAATALTNGDLDLALAGGVDISLDTFELIGFAKTGALTPTDMTVYDKRGDGFIPGEGCGFVVLKRLADATRDGDYVYAELNGWGISTDGRGGITAPSSVGQSKALIRAYERAGYSPHKLDFVEGHGTGTAVGDKAELEGIAKALQHFGPPSESTVGITSLKSLVGHTKAAAGIGGFIKTVLAVNQRVVPPTAKCEIPHPVFDDTAKPIYPVTSGEIRPSDEKLFAGVSAMGFGGINSHCTLTSADPPREHLRTELPARALLASDQDVEFLPLAASSLEELGQQVNHLHHLAKGIAAAEVADLAHDLSKNLEAGLPCRAALVASSPAHLLEALAEVGAQLKRTNAPGYIATSPKNDWWFGNHVLPKRVGFLFPGQGSQQLQMARFIADRYQWAADLVNQADDWLEELDLPSVSSFILANDDARTNQDREDRTQRLADTKVAQPAICLASILWLKFLSRLGMSACVFGGHSLGELTALHAAGAYDEKTLLQLAAVRGAAMSAESEAGGMLMLACDAQQAGNLIEEVDGYVTLANFNSPNQTVVSGSTRAIGQIEALAEHRKVETRRLPVSNAFHSKLVAKSAERIGHDAPLLELAEFDGVTYTSTTGEQIVPPLNLKKHLQEQIVSQVDFVAMQKAMRSECDYFIEVGPGRVLSGLMAECSGNAQLCLPVASKPQRFRDLYAVLGRWFISGGDPNWRELYSMRLVRPFTKKADRVFIPNQCENELDTSMLSASGSLSLADTSEHLTNGEMTFTDGELTSYFTQRSRYLAEIIRLDMESLPDSERASRL